MDFRDREYSRIKRFVLSFRFAFEGIVYLLKKEQNFRIHLLVGTAVLILGFLLGLSAVKMAILFLVIGIVLSLEAMNTGIERVVDLVTEEYHPLAKKAKDVSAAAVLIFSFAAAGIGFLFFFWPLVNLLF
ncbi:diacylglycerol kinase family protein [Pseudalkalibacillus caeni]|uniref:Diacylglycerol kinase family protein n=1 Tax=Exobacillus caeni TaxID=2574798 RepID=A0A5R9FFJ0_9BACL|nr:diacylglycerol kinase family protein [Pseudalkalibacillus caeni]TLS39364.1 diacylglycerol kinase family protein [Pseudalkalibacillus caeni]